MCRFLVLSLLCSLTGCSSLIYYPSRAKFVDDARLTRRPDEVKFKDQNGQDLVGWYFHAVSGRPKAVIVFFHGNGQNLSAHFANLYWILDHDYDFFIFDYPGYGISQGDPTPRNTVESGLAAVRWTRAKYPQMPLAVYGQSLGGAVATRTLVELKGDPPVCLAIFDSTFISYKAVARDVLGSHFWTWILQPFTYVVLSDKWTAKGRFAELGQMPAMFMHSEKDTVVRYKRGRELFESWNGPKEFITLKEPGHTNGFYDKEKELTRKKVLEQLSQYCSASKS